MYLNRIHSINVGPIEDASINCTITNNLPKPIVIVGENGTGKSILLSNIIDSLYEIAALAFSDAREKDNSSNEEQYYKTISAQEINTGKDFMYSYIEYVHENESIHSIFKSGKISYFDFKEREQLKEGKALKWSDENNVKRISATKKQAEDIFSQNVICYFGPDRYEKPNWMGSKYYDISNFEHLLIKQKWDGRLDKPISVTNVTPNTLQWLLDIIVDSRVDIDEKENNLNIAHLNKDNELAIFQNIHLLGIARKNVEKIMGEILGENIYFGLNYRNSNGARFNIKSSTDDKTIIPSLDSLSTGQIALFNIFATIIRYADSSDINKSITLDKITGIVVIDEIDLHLHTTLQRKILPKLLKLFPKVQFIISTHAPLFLLGMDEVYGKDGYEIYQMPSSIKIDSERFSEFQKAYNYLAQTEIHHTAIMKAIQENQDIPLVITEGATDWKHMKAAINFFRKQEQFKEKYSALNFAFLEYEPENSKKENCIKLNMGNKNLCAMCEQISKIKQSRKLIFIADADDKSTTIKLGPNNQNMQYKDWGNNVFSFILPLPNNRKDTPEICIEHYYTNDEIKTPISINGILRRLYIGNEFNERGISHDLKYQCININCCGKDKIKIIDGDAKSRVFAIDDSENPTNLALSKMDFATYILEEKPEFQHINHDNFHLIFTVINQILQEPLV